MPFRIAIRPEYPSPGPAGLVPLQPWHAAGTVLELAPGGEIFAQGDSSDLLYKLVSGVVRVCKPFDNGRRQIEAFHVAGDVFGFTLGAHRASYAEAVSDCTLLSYHRRAIEQLAQRDKAVDSQLLHHALRNLAQAQTHALLLGRRGAVEKLAAFLLDWAERSKSGLPQDQPELIPIVMSRQDIADYLGLTIETVSRSLTQLERENVIALPNARQLYIVNKAALAQLAA